MLSEVLELKHWQKIQDLFAEIISANLWLINPQGIPLTIVSKICTYCSDVNSSSYASNKLPDCALKAYQTLLQNNELFYQCSHSVSYFLIPIKQGDQPFAFIIGGPFILGKKETNDYYHSVCQQHGFDFENFLDWIRELKTFSHHRINLAVNFLKELACLLPTQKIDLSKTDYAKTSNLLSDSLLEIASGIVGADSGSVLLLNPAKNSFSIRSSRGLSPHVLKKKNIPLSNGIAGWVLENKKAILIGPEHKSIIPKSKLKRSYIKSSMIVPLEFQNKMYGVFCLNSKTENDQFNEDNLSFLNQLGGIAGAALSRSALLKN